MSGCNQISIILKIKKYNSLFIGPSIRFSFECNLEKVFHSVLNAVHKLGSCRNRCSLGRCLAGICFQLKNSSDYGQNDKFVPH